MSDDDDEETREEVRKLHSLYIDKFINESRDYVDRVLAANGETDASEWFSKERQRSIAFESWVIEKLADVYPAMELQAQAISSRQRTMELLLETTKINSQSTSQLAKMFRELADMVGGKS